MRDTHENVTDCFMVALLLIFFIAVDQFFRRECLQLI